MLFQFRGDTRACRHIPLKPNLLACHHQFSVSPALTPEQRPGHVCSPEPAAKLPTPPSSLEHRSYMELTLFWLNSKSKTHILNRGKLAQCHPHALSHSFLAVESLVPAS